MLFGLFCFFAHRQWPLARRLIFQGPILFAVCAGFLRGPLSLDPGLLFQHKEMFLFPPCPVAGRPFSVSSPPSQISLLNGDVAPLFFLWFPPFGVEVGKSPIFCYSPLCFPAGGTPPLGPLILLGSGLPSFLPYLFSQCGFLMPFPPPTRGLFQITSPLFFPLIMIGCHADVTSSFSVLSARCIFFFNLLVGFVTTISLPGSSLLLPPYDRLPLFPQIGCLSAVGFRCCSGLSFGPFWPSCGPLTDMFRCC